MWCWLLGRRDRPDALIHTLIAQKGARMIHTGFDPSLRERSVVRRKKAEAIRKKAAQVASRPLEDPKPIVMLKEVRRRV